MALSPKVLVQAPIGVDPEELADALDGQDLPGRATLAGKALRALLVTRRWL
jgi:hypothetical protein